MNGARTTFMRRGYLLTALAAAVLLAASAGPAWAQNQSVDFSVTSGTVPEGVAATARTAFTVTITRAGTDAETPFSGDVTLRHDQTGGLGTAAGQFQLHDFAGAVVDPAVALAFVRDEFTLVVVQAADNDWEDETITLELVPPVGTDADNGRLVLTADDDEDQPAVAFDPMQLDLYERNSATVDVSIAAAMNNPGTAIDTLSGATCGAAGNVQCQLQIAVDPPNAVGTAATDPVTIAGSGATVVAAVGPTMPGVFTIGANLAELGGDGTATPDMGTVMFTANPDSDGYRDLEITITPVAASLATDQGAIGAGSGLMLTVTSDEEVPVVNVVPTSVSVNEGDSTKFAIVADGMFGSEVMNVMLSMTGDAMVTLWQDGNQIMADEGGMYTVSLGSGSSSAQVTVMAESDRALEDGMTKEATFKIEDADGATIGDDNWVTITVNGSTAVPALPLIAQLLLALFLMAGGSRLYRRRRG